MDADKLKTAISKLTPTSAAAKLRQVMPEIEEQVEQGVRHEDIVAALNAEGIEVSLETFRKNLYRYRADQRKAGRPLTRASPPRVADGNPPADAPQGNDTAPSETEFEAAVDPATRGEVADKYVGRRRPIGINRSSKA